MEFWILGVGSLKFGKNTQNSHGFFREIQQQLLGNIHCDVCGGQVILVVLCKLPSASALERASRVGICWNLQKQDMLMAVDLVIIACGYAELILGEASKGERKLGVGILPQGFMVGYPPTTNENQ